MESVLDPQERPRGSVEPVIRLDGQPHRMFAGRASSRPVACGIRRAGVGGLERFPTAAPGTRPAA